MTEQGGMHLQRAQVLIQTGRYVDAEKELRKVLHDMPEHAHAHALLSLCLSHRLQHEAALREARTAISLEPDESLYHYFCADCLLRAKRLDEATASIGRAISIDPDDADYYYQLAAIQLEKNERKAARASLMRALNVDPEHADSLALLARLQAILGETQDAEHLANAAVRNRPQSADAHVSRGYTLLYAGNAKESFDAFREALRLNPNSEAARAGLLEAIKNHNIFYRLLFQFFAVMSRLSAKYQWGFIIGLYIGFRVLRTLMKQRPELTPVILPFVVLYVIFCFATWFADPIIYTLLWFSRWGRLAMTSREKMVGVATVALVSLAVICFAVMTTTEVFLFPLGFGCLLLVLPVTRGLNADNPNEMWSSAIASGLIAMFILLSAMNPVGIILAALTLIGYMFYTNYASINQYAPRD